MASWIDLNVDVGVAPQSAAEARAAWRAQRRALDRAPEILRADSVWQRLAEGASG